MNLSQYDGYLYMYILLLSFIPAIGLGLFEKKIKYYALIATAVMIYIIMGPGKQLNTLAIFMVWEVALIYIYFWIRSKTDNKWIFRLALLMSTLPLIINKVSPLTKMGVIGFIGISYLSFRTIQIVIETYDGTIKKLNLFDMIYFILFFPTLSSGPIDRSRRFEEEINKKIDRSDYVDNYLLVGIKKIFLGVLYKFAIAALIHATFVSKIHADGSLLSPFLYMYAYTLYLFFDFAGYSLIAVGTSYIFGVHAPDNFNKPFISKDIKEFWTRWHISLSRWFGDYIFSRFVLDSMRKKRFKKRAHASHVAQMITMTTMGFWHGITWFYILYGVYHGVLLILTDIFTKSKFHKKYKKKKAYQYLQIFITFNLVCFGMLIFSGFLNNYPFKF